ncbi:hypothetical protein [Prevotella sp.]
MPGFAEVSLSLASWKSSIPVTSFSLVILMLIDLAAKEANGVLLSLV